MKPDPLENFDRIAAYASNETQHSTMVTDRVLETLRRQSRLSNIRDPEYALVGCGAIAAACAALILFAMNMGDDSLMMLANPFFTEMP